MVSGIALPLPNYWGDYPRGVIVRGGQKTNGVCNPDQLLYSESWWRGSVERFQNGYLGLTPENNVHMYFSAPISVDCLKIEQTGYDDTFEWSIEEIDLLS